MRSMAVLTFCLGGCQLAFPLDGQPAGPVELRAAVTEDVAIVDAQPTYSITRPPEVQQGDSVLLAISPGPFEADVTAAPDGFVETWNHLMANNCFNQRRRTVLYAGIAGPPEEEPSYAFTFAQPVAGEAALIAYTNSAVARAHKRTPIVHDNQPTALVATTDPHQVPASSIVVILAHSQHAPAEAPVGTDDVTRVDDLAFFDHEARSGEVPAFELVFEGMDTCADLAEIVFEPP